jgi:hypothetical protein
MNKVIGLLLVIAIVIGVGPYAHSLSAPPVPPGISADNWIALGDSAGFVITNGDSLIGSTSSVGVARGYFMLQRGGTWLRIESTPN